MSYHFSQFQSGEVSVELEFREALILNFCPSDCEAVNNAVLDSPKQEEGDEPFVQEDLISRKSHFSVLDRNGCGHSSSHSSTGGHISQAYPSYKRLSMHSKKKQKWSVMACADLPEEDEQILVPRNRKTKETYVTGIVAFVKEEMCRFAANEH
jgi:hypothetical protein